MRAGRQRRVLRVGRKTDPLVAPRLILVLGDQLTLNHSALKAADRDRDVVVMAEVRDGATYVRHHKKKIALIFFLSSRFPNDAEGIWIRSIINRGLQSPAGRS